jgi:hypothetical protein
MEPHTAIEDIDCPNDEVPPKIKESLAAFRRELPGLLPAHYRQWVAFAGTRRVGIANSKTELYNRCLVDEHLNEGEFIVRRIVPAVDNTDAGDFTDV